ncbi:MAG TPA: site-2 protease family protein [Fimbriimonadaceae bacterium]|nr:site-2 protease family protein [Fimbriimonadaceae bacterium]
MIFFAIGIHEYCHCKFADMAGDPTPAFYGRVTLNLFKHFDLVGTAMIAFSSLTGYGLGWGKPAPIKPEKMRNPRLDAFIAVAAGPLSNLVQATLYAFALRFVLSSQAMTTDDVVQALNRQAAFLPSLLVLGVEINLGLFLFNLIPFGILDGHWLVGLAMPEKQRYYWFKFNRSYGWQILVAIILIGQIPSLNLLGRLFGPPLLWLFGLLTGVKLTFK